MSKRSMLKVGGFIATLATGALMIGTAVTGTGAYFTDSKSGTIQANSGHLRLSIADKDMSLVYADLMPGQDQSKNIDFTITESSGQADVWLVFDTSDGYKQWTGAKEFKKDVVPAVETFSGGLGRYGHVKIGNGVDANLFQSYNLALPPVGEGPNCADEKGWAQGAKPINRDQILPYCGVPNAIRIAENLSTGATGTVKIAYGLTGRWGDTHDTAFMDRDLPNVPFKVVATQTGVRPPLSATDKSMDF